MHIPAVFYLNQPIITVEDCESHAESLILSGFGGGNPRPLLAMSEPHTNGVSLVTTIKLNFDSSPVETETLAILWLLSMIAPHPVAVDHTSASSILVSSYSLETEMTKSRPSLQILCLSGSDGWVAGIG